MKYAGSAFHRLYPRKRDNLCYGRSSDLFPYTEPSRPGYAGTVAEEFSEVCIELTAAGTVQDFSP